MSSARWGAVTDWYIDPAVTHGGSDRNDGLTSSTPIKSVAEWRRRVDGAVYTTDVFLHALSGSTVIDDGFFYGFTFTSTLFALRVVGTPVLMGVSGTVQSYVAPSGNIRAQFTDSSITTSWTASNAISNGTGSKWVRRTGTGTRHYAHLLKDLGSKTVQIGIVVDWNETDAVTVQTAETNFANGDTYEVVSLPSWPSVIADQGNITFQCFDILGFVTPSFSAITANTATVSYRLCGLPQNIFVVSANRIVLFYSCVFCVPSPAGVSAGAGFYSANGSFVNTILQLNTVGYTISGVTNVVVNSEIRIWHSAALGSLGFLRMFDCAAALISVRHDATCKITGGISGSGNSGALVDCNTGGIFYGANLITATTSAPHPYLINGVSHDSPAVETSGDAIYP